MIKKINNLIKYIDDENSIFHKKLVSIASRLSKPCISIKINLEEMKSMIDPDLVPDDDIRIPLIKIDGIE